MLEGELTSIAFCWRIERRDGVCLGFTTHDRDLTIDGLAYRQAPGMLPSAISLSDGFDADALEVRGALTSDAITSEDLRAGRWDGAAVSIFLVDWEQPGAGQLGLARGSLGDVSLAGSGFTAELLGPTADLDRPAVEQTSPGCRAQLGDKRCRIDIDGRVRMVRIVTVAAEDVIGVEDVVVSDNAYAYGRLRWITGANSGLESAILRSEGIDLTLREPAPFEPQAGDLVELVEGCDKTFETCCTRFTNALNFRGEPHLPGNDLLTRYGGV